MAFVCLFRIFVGCFCAFTNYDIWLINFIFQKSICVFEICWLFFNEIYIFPELNEKSLALATDIKQSHRTAKIVFADVFENNDEVTYELIERARELGAICFKKDILAVNFKLH